MPGLDISRSRRPLNSHDMLGLQLFIAICAFSIVPRAGAQSLFGSTNFVTYGGTSLWHSPVGGEFTGDGIPDIVCAGSTTSLVTIPGSASLGFGFPTIAQFPSAVESPMVVGDLDGDGLDDVVCGGVPGVTVMLRSTGGGWTVASQYAPPVQARSALVTEMDGSPGAEVVVLGSNATINGTDQIVVHSNTGGFLTSVVTLTASNALRFVVGDFDGNGLPDIAYVTRTVTGNPTPSQAWVLLQTSQNAYMTTGPYTLPLPGAPCVSCTAEVRELLASDLDDDGRDELIVGANQAPFNTTPGPSTLGHVTVFPGSASTVLGSPFQFQPVTPAICTFGRTQVADFDQDGSSEFLVHFQPPTALPDGYLLRYAPGDTRVGKLPVVPSTDFAAIHPAALSGLRTLALDMDADGDLDLAHFLTFSLQTHVGVAENLSIYRRACPPGAPPLLSLIGKPAPGNAGFGMALAGALPSVPCALGISIASGNVPLGGCTLWLDLSVGALLSPTATFGTLLTDAQGTGFLPIPIPLVESLVGANLYIQWVAVDPQGPIITPTGNFRPSDSRRVMVW